MLCNIINSNIGVVVIIRLKKYIFLASQPYPFYVSVKNSGNQLTQLIRGLLALYLGQPVSGVQDSTECSKLGRNESVVIFCCMVIL